MLTSKPNSCLMLIVQKLQEIVSKYCIIQKINIFIPIVITKNFIYKLNNQPHCRQTSNLFILYLINISTHYKK